MTELPFHPKKSPYARPADAFLADQAALVAPRKAAMARVNLMPEHDALVPTELRQAPADGAAEPADVNRIDESKAAGRMLDAASRVPDAYRRAPHMEAAPATPAAPEPAVQFDAVDERPTPEYDVERFAAAKKLPKEFDGEA